MALLQTSRPRAESPFRDIALLKILLLTVNQLLLLTIFVPHHLMMILSLLMMLNSFLVFRY